ncbi:PTS sugar transporter subunit IIB [Paenibacillus kribbensis]|uniref:PTS sugar transporter subunit IIB n=1 Tax=Paenibacillus kribbensis TaxID=172713 RepID=UPI000837CF05|nr:PTS sugar transporter subunit IIB [Paenibacillus kribbensis]
MKKILLACAGGFSTSMLVEKMKEAARAQNVEILIEACSESSIREHMPVDIVMLGPQMGHAEDDVKKEVGNEIPVTVINMMDYGMMNGPNVLKTALDMI